MKRLKAIYCLFSILILAGNLNAQTTIPDDVDYQKCYGIYQSAKEISNTNREIADQLDSEIDCFFQCGVSRRREYGSRR